MLLLLVTPIGNTLAVPGHVALPLLSEIANKEHPTGTRAIQFRRTTYIANL